jgi:hypothetical protein
MFTAAARGRHWKDHFKNDLRSDQDHRLKIDLRSDQENVLKKKILDQVHTPKINWLADCCRVPRARKKMILDQDRAKFDLRSSKVWRAAHMLLEG